MLTVTDAPRIASGGLYENNIAFEFCEKWDGFTKTGVFYNVPYKPYKNVIDEDGLCIIPPEVTAKTGNMFFGVVGVNEQGITRTSLVIPYHIDEGANDTNAVISNPTQEFWQQCLAEIAKAMVATQEVREDVSKVVGIAEEAEEIAKNHAERHGKNGRDPLTPKAIGAAEKNHEHGVSDIKDFPTMDRAYVDENKKLHIIGFTASATPGGAVSDEQIEAAVEKYLQENPLESVGVPSGGKTGQYLRKVSDNDGDVEWADFEIPAEYGLITYDNTKTLTIT